MRLEHVNLTVADLGRSVRFYRRLFGFVVRWEGDTDGGQPAAHVGNDGTYLALFEGEPSAVERDYGRVGFNHFAFAVPSLDDARARLLELGAEIHLEADYDPGPRLYFTDPDGYEVELVEEPPV